MRKLAVAALVACSAPAPRPVAPAPAPRSTPAATTPMLKQLPAATDETTTFVLSKFAAEIGSEEDTYVANAAGGIDAKAVFAFRDRTTTVPLAATVSLDREGRLVGYHAWGATSRGTSIDDSIVAVAGGFEVTRQHAKRTRVAPAGLAVAVSSYAPMLTLELALQAWNQHGRPATLAMLPEGTLTIESRGPETFDNLGTQVTLEHLAIVGLVWGREDAWLDGKGRLVAVVTRDDEFDHFEAMRRGFTGLMPQLLKRAAADGSAWLGAHARTAVRPTAATFALAGGRLVDGTNRAPVEDAVVVITGDKIVAAGPRASVKIPEGATVIDVTGKSILPGLWDMHAHVEQVEQLAAYLAAGVTTVRDMGNIFDFIIGLRDAIDAGTGFGPRVIASCIVDGNGEGALGAERIKTQADIQPMVDKLVAAKCAEIKLYSSIASDLLKPIITYAHKRGLRAVGHVPFGMSVPQVIDAGYDSISHIMYLTDVMFSKAQRDALSREDYMKRFAAMDLAAPAMTKQLDALARHKVVIDDTLALYEQFLTSGKEREKREPGVLTLPRELRGGLGTLAESETARSLAMFTKLVELVKLLHQRGITVVAGTDISVPGHSVHREIELYVEAGFTTIEAIQAATIVPARVLGRDKQLGTIEPG
ncbi:MAG: amidohydrolase family protein, partial [Kofleriaceae bacterium]